MPLSFIMMLAMQAGSVPAPAMVAFDAQATIISSPTSGQDDPTRYDKLIEYLGCLEDATLRFEPLGEPFDAVIEVSKSACWKSTPRLLWSWRTDTIAMD